MAEVSFQAVGKTYPGSRTEVIKGISARVADGELMVLLGPSGCGKSTLLRMVAGLERISRGTMAINGRIVNDLEPKDRNIAMVFQNYALYPHMSVFDNMAYGLRIARIPRAEIRARVAEAAQILELTPFLKRKPGQLSGGQRQRVAMGRAIVRNPQVFLFDEPLSNLDAKLRTQMRVEIKKLQTRLGVTSLYVTHDQAEAMTLADRIMVINDGVAEQVAPPLEVYRRPASAFVAGFIGTPAMNFLAGRLCGDGRAVELAGGVRLGLPAPVAGGPMAGGTEGAITVGIRPESLRLDNGHGDLAVAVDLTEMLGADSVVHGRLADNGSTLVARLSGIVPARPGDRLRFTIAADALHLFDTTSGRRLDA
ncbi:MAG: sn-glycerol-3-phosphate import ATP-binding protein UgpC [Rhodospirillales bacterium]|nr:MAG: sn-glycerol-3-phosphate import ATP-binding protein UgpC [Rhodospirillales bacterium]